MFKSTSMTVESVLGTVTFDKKSFTGEAPGDGSFEAVVGVRPELAEILDGPAEGSIEAEVYSVMPAGSETTIYLEVGGERILYRTMCSWWGMRRETVRPRRTTGYTIILSW